MIKPNYTYNATVTSVYDGDTITLDIDLGFNVRLAKVKVRLSRINAPEVRGSERTHGLVVRDYLRGVILNKEVVFKSDSGKKGKYGRYLGTVFLNDIDIVDHLIETFNLPLYS